MSSTEQRVVFVTGCSDGGIGSSLCNVFASRGCVVYATARRSEAMHALGLKSALIKCRVLDVTDEKATLALVDEIHRTERRIDIVVNCAGIFAVGPLAEMDTDYVVHNFDVNVFSAHRIAKAVIPIMAKQKSGLIINVGSLAGDIPLPWSGLYAGTKAALNIMTEVLTMECQPFNIRVMLLLPGAVRSNISSNASQSFSSLSDNSLYRPFYHNILRRMNASQGDNTMSRDTFADIVVKKALQPDPPRYFVLGGNTILLAVLKFLPRSFVSFLTWRMFSKPAKY